MNEIEVIRYLLDEIEVEIKYNEAYERGKYEEAPSDRDKWFEYMADKFTREPRQSVIKDNAKMIRRLALKIFKEG